MSLHRVEIPTEALAVWRKYSKQKPTLLLLSSDPMLTPVPSDLRAEVTPWVLNASPAELTKRGLPQAPDLLLPPIATTDAALRAGLFGQVIWAIPLRKEGKNLDIESIRQRFRDKGQLTEREADSLQLDGPVMKTTVRGVPFTAGTLPDLPKISAPLVVHIDLSYIQELYKNEVTSPLLPTVYQVLQQLRERKLPVLAVTFSYGNLDERIALDVRFLGDVIARAIEQPATVDQSVPINWQRLGNILYLKEFIKKDEIRELARAMEKDEPDAAWIKFALYRSAAEDKKGTLALSYLAQAAARDRIYAVEYLTLAETAYDKKRPDAALQMFNHAARAFPDNPQIKVKMAQLAAEMGDRKTALHLVEQLRKLPWSTVYNPQMPGYLNGFAEYLQKNP